MALRRLLVLAIAAVAACAPPPPDGRLFLLLTIDTLRADRLGTYGSPRGLTPALDRLAARSTVYETCLSPSSWTMPAMGTLGTGLRPNDHGMIYWHLPLSASVPETLAERLADAGIATAFVGNPIPRLVDLDRGFETWRTFEGDDAAAVDAAREWLRRERTRDRFLWVHLLSPHAPYDPAPGTRRPADGLAARTADYDAEVLTTDRHVERLLAALPPSTPILVSADHGETLDERRELSYDHGKHLFDELVRVPLIAHWPGEAPRVAAGAAQLADVPATVAAWFGEPLEDVQGRALLPGAEVPPLPRTFAFVVEDEPPARKDRRWSVRDADRKAVFNLDRERVRYFDLSRDPGERRNLAKSREPEVAELRTALQKWLEASPTPSIPFDQKFSPEEMRRLESLGYLGGGD